MSTSVDPNTKRLCRLTLAFLTSEVRSRYRSLILRTVRDLETIDSELRLLAAVRRVCREQGGTVPSMGRWTNAAS